MPDAPRRSSTGTRRGPPKPHVPFRGENFDVAKKTGVRVQRTEVGSDGFEPFEDVVRQADTLTPYQVKGKKKKNQSLPEEDFEDEDDGGGEEDMDLVDSPIHYIANARQPSSPPISRPSARSRPVSRSTNDLYDSIPSPHSAAHRSRTNGRSAGPSRLSQQHSVEDDFDMSLTTNGAGNYSDNDLPIDDSPSPSQQSFVALDNDDEEEEQEQEDDRSSTPVPAPRSKSQAQDMSTPKASTKGRPSAHTPRAGHDDFDDLEGDMSQLPDDVDVPGPQDEEEEEEEEPEEQPKGKKIRVEEPKEVVARRAKATKGQSSSLKENRVEGVRRSQRKSYKPLQFWRNEKVVYGRPNHKNGQILVPHIREIIRIPEEPAEPLGAASKKRKRSTRSRSHAPEAVANPEEGWDVDSAERGEVFDWATKQLLEKRIACPPSKVTTQRAAGAEWEFQKIFGDEQFIAAGQLLIPPKRSKPSKTTKDNTYVFCIMEGAVNVKINETSIILCTGGMFMVPRGNQYFIENISNRPARLFFAQARMVAKDDAERTASPEKPRVPTTSTSNARAGTAGPATSTAANSDTSRLKRSNTTAV
ncbi:mitotic fidelity of chromosome transmission-related protein [Marasmius tenuissimus]|uniref:Mitotic fidelity of chromosome transmission-related protein n=1 Tax=Marasmius tenuissimus TaxID=585030 RepID=A0ABR2ZPG8_9AGAR